MGTSPPGTKKIREKKRARDRRKRREKREQEPEAEGRKEKKRQNTHNQKVIKTFQNHVICKEEESCVI